MLLGQPVALGSPDWGVRQGSIGILLGLIDHGAQVVLDMNFEATFCQVHNQRRVGDSTAPRTKVATGYRRPRKVGVIQKLWWGR